MAQQPTITASHVNLVFSRLGGMSHFSSGKSHLHEMFLNFQSVSSCFFFTYALVPASAWRHWQRHVTGVSPWRWCPRASCFPHLPSEVRQIIDAQPTVEAEDMGKLGSGSELAGMTEHNFHLLFLQPVGTKKPGICTVAALQIPKTLLLQALGSLRRQPRRPRFLVNFRFLWLDFGFRGWLNHQEHMACGATTSFNQLLL